MRRLGLAALGVAVSACVTAHVYVPYVAGEFAHVYAPANGRYLNDHAIARGDDGTWHLYGITGTTQGDPQREHSMLHATAPSLAGPWTDEPDVLEDDPLLNEKVMWAPDVFERAPGAWTMLYWAGWLRDETPARGLRRAESTDLTHWTRDPHSLAAGDRPPGGRDPMVLRERDRWLLYTADVDGASHGEIRVSESRDGSDPRHWSEPAVVLTDPVANFEWGNLESPYVVHYGEAYYLFVTRVALDYTDYVRTNVFRSRDPTHFAWQPITDMRAHAAEVVRDGDAWFITSAGWTENVGEQNRGLLLAPLGWARASE